MYDYDCRPICGNGYPNVSEQCDDGNLVPNDGCTNCTIDPLMNCSFYPYNECWVIGICGNSKIEPHDENCDDGNTADLDGCEHTCHLEPGWNCSGVPTNCSEICGDYRITGKETCEDGNLALLDGCSDKCKVETGWNCTDTIPSICTEICGDGKIVGNETCDDGNNNDNNGCKIGCKDGYLDKWTCQTSTTSVCKGICGDGFKMPGEACDAGPLTGCKPDCLGIADGW